MKLNLFYLTHSIDSLIKIFKLYFNLRITYLIVT